MPIDAADLEARIALCTADDRVRGMMFNEVLKLVETQAGPAGRADAARVLPEGTQYKDLSSYPITDLMRLMYRASDVMKKHYDGHEQAMQACGAATVDAFSRTPAGKMLFGVIALAGPAHLLRGAGVGYKSVVTYGSRAFEPTGSRSGVIRMTRDMLPTAYHEGVFLAVLRAVGQSGRVVGRQLALDSAEYAISWGA